MTLSLSSEVSLLKKVFFMAVAGLERTLADTFLGVKKFLNTTHELKIQQKITRDEQIFLYDF